MKRTVNQHEFVDAFRKMGRVDSFSYEGRMALFDYLEQLEEDVGEEIELDVIAICCDYSEYDTALEAATEYGFKPNAEWLATPAQLTAALVATIQDDEDKEEQAIEWLNDRTTVIQFDGGVIIQGF